MKKETTAMTEQTNIPEFLQDVPAVQAVKAEIVDMENLSKRLESATSYIRKEVGNVAKSFCRIGFKLWEVKENKLYIGQGYKNISEYGEKVLGFRKSSTANYISVCERFSVRKGDKPTAQLMDNFSNFSYGQLSLMLSLPEDKVNEITPEATCKEIREIKKAERGGDDQEAAGAPGVKINPPIVVFERQLTQDNLPIVIKLLRENVGREMYIAVEDIGE